MPNVENYKTTVRQGRADSSRRRLCVALPASCRPGQQEHERQIKPAEGFAYGLIFAKTVLRGHDGLQRGRQAALGRGARPAGEADNYAALFVAAIDNDAIK